MEKNIEERIFDAYCMEFGGRENVLDLSTHKDKILSDFAKSFYMRKDPSRIVKNFFALCPFMEFFSLAFLGNGGFGPDYNKEQIAEKIVELNVARDIEEARNLIPEVFKIKFPSWSFWGEEAYFREFHNKAKGKIMYRMYLKRPELDFN